jgi:cell division protein ZipA
MTFIIALGVIIILLCSASVFKLMQPKDKAENVRKKRTHSASSHKQTTQQSRPAAAARHRKMKSKPVIQADPAVEEPVIEKPVMKAPELPTVDDRPKVEAESRAPVSIPEVISLNLYSEDDKPYSGYELLQALLSCGMRFGVMNMFHRHQKKTGVGPILFSLASCTKDGVFDLAKIGEFKCKGLVLFLKPQEVDDPVKVYSLMLETADQLINDLGGKVLNDKLQLLKKDDVVATHQLFTQYMKDRKTMDLFE